LSSTHYNVPKANFTKDDILSALEIQEKSHTTRVSV
jgi:hypothetical protein